MLQCDEVRPPSKITSMVVRCLLEGLLNQSIYGMDTHNPSRFRHSSTRSNKRRVGASIATLPFRLRSTCKTRQTRFLTNPNIALQARVSFGPPSFEF